MKKLWIIGGVIVAIFVILIALQSYSKNEKMKNNPYDKEKGELNASTIDLLNNKNYQDIILMDELDKKIESGEKFVAYFFSPTCVHCQKFTPIMMDVANENDLTIYKFNLLEYPEGVDKFTITGTPTTIVFSDGKELNRAVGEATKEICNKLFS